MYSKTWDCWIIQQFLFFEETPVFQIDYAGYIPSNSTQGLLFSTILPISTSCLLDNSHSNRYKVILQLVLTCISLMINDVEFFLSYTCQQFEVSFENYVFMSFAHFLTGLFFLLSYLSGLYILVINSIRYMVYKHSLSFHMLSLHSVSFAVQLMVWYNLIHLVLLLLSVPLGLYPGHHCPDQCQEESSSCWFTVSSPIMEVISPFRIDFCMWCEIRIHFRPSS